jgi:hypothetical protein
MTHVTNLVCFPGIPHKAHFGSVKTAPGCDSAGSLAIRLLLKEIIDSRVVGHRKDCIPTTQAIFPVIRNPALNSVELPDPLGLLQERDDYHDSPIAICKGWNCAWRRTADRLAFAEVWIVEENDIQERTVDLDVTIVVDEAQASKLIHKEAHAAAGRSDHLCEGLLTDLRQYWLGFALLAEIGQDQQQARKPFFTGIEELIDQIRLDTDGPSQKIGNE